jgi:hypothetical protein
MCQEGMKIKDVTFVLVICQSDLLDGSVGFTQGKLGCSSSSCPPPTPNGHQLLENEELIKM